jgi:hypothetical protein
MSETEPKTLHLQTELNDMVKGAVLNVCGPEYVEIVVGSPGSEVKMYQKWASAGDFICTCAKTIFRRHLGMMKQRGVETGGLMEVTTVSEYGLETRRAYKNARELARCIVNNFPENNRIALVADARIVDRGGHIIITSKPHLEWHMVNDRLPCLGCGLFYNAGQAMRMHQVWEHKMDYGDAQEVNRTTEWQVVLYTASKSDLQSWTKEALTIAQQKDTLQSDGLEACRTGDLDGLVRLVEAGLFDPLEAEDRNGSGSFCWAAGGGYLDMCKYLYNECKFPINLLKGKRKRRRHPLHWAARNGHISVVAWLVRDVGIDVGVGTEDGTTALHYAAWNGQSDMVRFLVDELGCDVNQLNSHGCNASQWCAMNGEMGILRYLHERHLDVTLVNHNGHSALHKGAMRGTTEVCKWLLLSVAEGGGGLGWRHVQPDRDGFCPMLYAKHNGFNELAEWLRKEQRKLSVTYEADSG